MNRINIDNVPTLARPKEVERAISEARELRERLRLAEDERAKAQQAFEQAQAADVAAQAERVRQGSAPGALPPALEKARRAVELAQRNTRASGLATEQAEQDVVAAIGKHADAWGVSLQDAAGQARETGKAALVAIESALSEIGDAGSAQNWLAGAMSDGRFDRPAKPVLAFALSSRHRTANDEPLGRDELLAFVTELLAPPTVEPAAVLEADVA